MRICTSCGARYRDQRERCPLDGGALKELPDPLLGRLIAGRYRVAERIGAGGMGVVYRAEHEVVGGDVALKFLATQLAYDPANRARFLREARAANRINHEHIIDITDYGETDDGRAYLVMEYLVGEPLNEVIADGALPVPRALEIAIQCARALSRAHELGVVHRDIKPDNIYLLQGYRTDFVKLLDFGLAHMKGELRVTATGTVFGTPEYMAPEQARGASIRASADLYSLGCVLFEMLTGQLPFTGSAPDLIVKHLREPPPAPSRLRPGIPPELDALVLRLLAKAPDERPPSALEVADTLETLRGWGPAEIAPPVLQAPAPARDTLPSVGATVASWAARVERLEALVARAHPEGAPAWLPPLVAELRRGVADLATLQEKLSERVTIAVACEDEARQVRLRLGHAIDALAADQAQLRRERSERSAELDQLRRRLREVSPALREAWRRLPSPAEEPSEDDLKALATIGELATAHREAQRRIRTLESELADLASREEDLRFQVEQLKGRLGGLNAVAEIDLDSLREQTFELDRQWERRLEEVAALGARLADHLAGFPRLRDTLDALEP